MAIQQIPDGSWVSNDGRWLWRGSRWEPMPAAGEAGVFWFVSSPNWLPTILLMGLIGLIPFVGAMNVYGYAIVTARNLRAGYRVLPPANFDYIRVGAPVFVFTFAWAALAFVLMLAVGGGVALATYGRTHSLAWTIALGAVTGFTVLGLANIPTLPLFVPALEMSEREGWGIFRVGRLFRHATGHWRSAWYGAAILILWYAIYFALSIVFSVVPLGSILAAVVGLPLVAPMVAIPIARFNDPPAGFTKRLASALAAAWLALWVLGLAAEWAVVLTAGSIVSSHPDEASCFFESGCNFAYAGNKETIARVHRDQGDPTLVTVDVTFINRSTSPGFIDAADYSARTSTGLGLPPSSDCPAPGPTTVAPGERLQQHLCIRLPDATTSFEIHLPWTGWDFKTG